MTETQEKLKPCQCGSSTVYTSRIHIAGEGNHWWQGRCDVCKRRGPVCRSIREATEEWNTRTEEARIAELEEALTLAVEWFTDCPDDPIEFSATLQHLRNALKGNTDNG